MTTILVTDGEQRAALALVRSLGKAGHRMIVTSSLGHCLAGSSRQSAAQLELPDSLIDPESCARRLAEICRAEAVDLLIPVTEASLLAALDHSTRLPHVTIPWPDAATVRRVSDKALLMEVAPELGIAIPAQHCLERASDIGAIGSAQLRFPLVVKPARSMAEAAGQRYRLTVRHALDHSGLVAIVSDYPAAAFPLLLQHRIVGPGVGVFLLLWKNRLLARFAHRRIREKPPSGGVSVYRESIAIPPELEARSRALLERLGWDGVAMIEYKLDQTTGTPYLMEINGRFWGSLQLAIDAGVDFPRLLVDAALGKNPTPVLDYRRGVRSRWWWGDVDHLLARFTKSDPELALPPGSPGRLRTALAFLRLWWPGDRNEILRWSDPRPFVHETGTWLRGQ